MDNSTWVTRTSWRTHAIALIAALAFSSVVFLPLLGFKGRLATFMYGSDAFDFWLPQFNLLQHYIQTSVFQGMDYFTHNGSAEWFLRPNLTAYYPPYLIAALLVPANDLALQAGAIIVIQYVGAFFSVYFSILLAHRFFGFSRTLSIFVAIGFTFSWHFLVQISYVPFAFIAWLMPPVIYYSLSAAAAPTVRNIAAGAFAAFCLLTAGYLPLSLQALSLAGLFVAFFLLNERQKWPSLPALGLAAVRAGLPVIIAAAVASPWLLAILRYSKTTIQPEFDNNIAYSAYDLSELPQTLLRAVSGNLKVPGPFFEFSANIGLLVVALFLLFITIHRQDVASVTTVKERRTMWFGLAVFLFSWLIIYGSNSTLASVFYFFAPVAGFSHLYQRYIPLAQFFLLLSAAQMLRVLILIERPRLERQWVVGMGLAVVGLAALAGLQLNDQKFGFTQELIVETLYVAIFLVVLVAIRGQAVVWVALLAMFLPALDRGYEYATLPQLRYETRKPLYLPLNTAEMEAFDAQLASYRSQKDILKVVDITPGVHGYIPENYPWFRAQNIALSWYSGYDWHVGVPLQYRAINRMNMGKDGQLRFAPSPVWVAATGADVLIYDPNDTEISPDLLGLIDTSRPSVTTNYAGGQFVIAPLLQSHAPRNPAADNGYFRLAAEGAISDFASNGAGDFDFAVNSTTAGALQYQFWPTTRLQVWVNDVHVETFLNPEGIMSIPVEAGTSVIKVRYTNVLLTAFLWFYGIFVVGLLAALLWPVLVALLALRRRKAPMADPVQS